MSDEREEAVLLVKALRDASDAISKVCDILETIIERDNDEQQTEKEETGE